MGLSSCQQDGDFEYVKEKGVEFWLAEREPIEQF